MELLLDVRVCRNREGFDLGAAAEADLDVECVRPGGLGGFGRL